MELSYSPAKAGIVLASCKTLPMPDSLAFRVEQWDEAGNRVEELIAAAGNVLVARAAYEAAVKLRPGTNITLRNHARVIERTRAG